MFSLSTPSRRTALKKAAKVPPPLTRQYALGASFTAGDLYLTGIVTQTNLKSLGEKDVEDPLTVSLGGNYDFGVAKLYVATQYFKDSDLSVKQIDRHDAESNATGCQKASQFDGFGLSVGAGVPAFGGTAKVLVGYMDAEDQSTAAQDVQRYAFSVGYEYPLSKRTFLYGVPATTWTPMTRLPSKAMMTRLPSPPSMPASSIRSNNCPFA